MRRVRDYIFQDISSVNETSTIRRVIRTMKLNRITTVPVEDQTGRFVGCISERDILKASVPEYMKSIYNTSFMADLDQISVQLKGILDAKAIDFVDKTVPTLKPGDSMSYAADMLYRSQTTALPVVEDDVLIGFISRIDVLMASADSSKIKHE
jgi:CBS domain-containing protein